MPKKVFVVLLLGGLLAAGCAGGTETDVSPLPVEPEGGAGFTPSVSVSDQDASDGTVTIEEVVAAEPGWLVIHTTRNGGPGPVIGQSPVEVGPNPDVEVDIDLAQATGQLFAMLHVDHGTAGVYEFPGDDTPASAGDQIVNVPFQASFPIEPSVTVSDQASAEGTVTIDGVTAADAGWIVIHADADGAPGPVIGQAPVIVGFNPEVAVEIDLSAATPTLYAMLHLDAGSQGTYEFPGDDAPVFDAADNIVLTPFTLSDAQSGAEEEMAEDDMVVEVMVVDTSFELEVIEVPVGTTVTWIYDGSLPHTVTADDGSFNSPTLGTGQSFSFTFEEVGTFPYFCRFHGGAGGSGMSGIVNVVEG